MKKLIFIVDDEVAITKLLTFWVKDKWGYDAKVFSSGDEMLKHIGAKPDLILLGIMLPGMGGFETLKSIRQFNESLPVIVLSATDSKEVAVESFRLGAYNYFLKPLDQQRLGLAVKNAIINYDLTKEMRNLKENVKREYSFDNIDLPLKVVPMHKLVSTLQALAI